MATQLSSGKWLAKRQGSSALEMRLCDTEEEAIQWESK